MSEEILGTTAQFDLPDGHLLSIQVIRNGDGIPIVRVASTHPDSQARDLTLVEASQLFHETGDHFGGKLGAAYHQLAERLVNGE